MSSMWEPPLPEELQALLPQYEITGILGRGGMGAVYRGRQPRLDRDVAIKLLPETLLTDGDEMNYAKRFEQEAQAMAKLSHPGIISIYDFGETSAGQFYFVMEFIDGMDIHQYLKQAGGKIPQNDAIAIVSHVLDALSYAHGHGIVHRDIKPANILLDREGRIKIADFGLAKRFTGGETSGLTLSNVAVGTPDFVAPEALVMGKTVDQRADIYAVGVMLYQLLTGQIPRAGYKFPSQLDPEIDSRLDEIVSKAIEPDPEYRYSSAEEVRSAINIVLSQPIPQATKEAIGSVAKSKTPLYAGIGIAAVLVISVIAFFAMRSSPPASESTPLAANPVATQKSSAEPQKQPEPKQSGPSIDRAKEPEPAPAVTKSDSIPLSNEKKEEEPQKKSESARPEPKVELTAKEDSKSKTSPASTAESKPVSAISKDPKALSVTAEDKLEKPAKAPESAAPPKMMEAVSTPAPAPSQQNTQPDPIASVPELSALHGQFLKLQEERVSQPFSSEVAKLNELYLGGIDQKIASERAAGHLDGVLALEAEKKAIREQANSTASTTSAVPGSDPEGTIPALSELRTIYRDAYGKLLATRDTNRKQLTDPLDARLQQLETTLTQQNRIDHAKIVRSYREKLVQGSGEDREKTATSVAGSEKPKSQAMEQASAQSNDSIKRDERAVVAMALSKNGSAVIEVGKERRTVTKEADLPEEDFRTVELVIGENVDDGVTVSLSDEEMRQVVSLKQLESIKIIRTTLSDSGAGLLADLPNLQTLRLRGNRNLRGNYIASLAGIKNLALSET